MTNSQAGASPEARGSKVIRWIFLCLLAGECILTSIDVSSARSSPRADFILLILGTVTTLITLSRDLPWQNVIAVSVIIGAIAIGVQAGFLVFQRSREPFVELFWPMPLVWIIAILNARGILRLVLIRWRSIPTYGFWLLGLTAFLATMFFLSWHYLWKTGNRTFHVYGTRLCQALLISTGAQLLSSPWLIQKRPGEKIPAWEPLSIWLGFNLLFITGAFSQSALFAAAFLLLINLLILSLAMASHFHYCAKS